MIKQISIEKVNLALGSTDLRKSKVLFMKISDYLIDRTLLIGVLHLTLTFILQQSFKIH